MKIAHVISSLHVGGAELMLTRLIESAAADVEPVVVCLIEVGVVGERLRRNGIPVVGLEMTRGVPDPRATLRLARLLRQFEPDVVQSWMYHADLVSAVATRLADGPPLVWGIRQTELSYPATKRSTRAIALLCARLSGWLPQRIVCCSERSLETHLGIGYDPDRMTVIPNGFDLDRFRPDPESRAAIRKELGVTDEVELVGLGARFDAAKDHRGFATAAGIVARAHPHARFVLWGTGIDAANHTLAGWLESAGLDGRYHLLGERDDVPRLAAALDVAASSSLGEGFPNAVAEAMASGVPCAVTDVGESRAIVGDAGRVVAPREPEALARALLELLALPEAERREMGRQARYRIETNYSIRSIADRYHALHREVMETARVGA